jgi:hypothetical protein
MASPRDPNRIRRVRHLKSTAPGWIAVVICRKCGHMAALPYDRLLKRFGELFPADDALIWIGVRNAGHSRRRLGRRSSASRGVRGSGGEVPHPTVRHLAPT